jgi:hypothetical protein
VIRAARCFAIFIALILAGGQARATEPSEADRERLAKLLREGADAAQANKWDACINAYTSAVQIESTPERLGELGLCEEAHGQRDVEGYRHLHAALHSAGVDRTLDPSKLTQYEKGFARVAERVAEVYISATPPSATMFVNGREIGRTDGRTLLLTPGHYTFTAQLKGYKGKPDVRDLLGGDKAVVDLKLEAEHAQLPPASTGGSISAWLFARPERIALVAVTGLAALTAASSGGTAIGLEVDRGSYGSKFTPSSCFSGNSSRPPECAAAQERAHQADAAVDVMAGALVVSGIGAAITGVLFVVDRPSPHHPSIVPTASKNGGGIVVLAIF